MQELPKGMGLAGKQKKAVFVCYAMQSGLCFVAFHIAKTSTNKESIINIICTYYIGGFLANVCVSVSEEMQGKLKKFETVNWSAVARQAFARELSKLELMDKLTAKSKATDKDIEEISEKIKTGVAKWHNERA